MRGPYYTVLGDDLVDSDQVVLRRVDQGVAQLVEAHKADEKRRKWMLILSAAGVVFAAAKFGFIAIPHIRKWRQ